MKYYVVSDVHSYYSVLVNELTKRGFFDEPKDKRKLIILGDLFDRGKEALKLQDFILELLKNDEVILIKGNHEDLMMDLLNDPYMWCNQNYLYSHHNSNGTISTIKQLTKRSTSFMQMNPDLVRYQAWNTPYVKDIIPKMKDYFETDKYIFVHGWIPCTITRISYPYIKYLPNIDWRNAGAELWEEARWINGMDAAYDGVIEENKTIICGHYHTSYGHYKYEGVGSEFDKNADFSPYYAKGIIAIDACTAFSKKMNCLILED